MQGWVLERPVSKAQAWAQLIGIDELLHRVEAQRCVHAGILGLPFPGTEIGIALSIVALSLAITFAWHPPEWVAVCLIAYFAFCHGYAHGAELPLAADPADYVIVFVLATGLIHLCGIGIGLGLGKPFGGVLPAAWGR